MLKSNPGGNNVESEALPQAENNGEQAKPGWWALYKSDLKRYILLRRDEPLFTIFVTEQALWALFQFRVASAIYQSGLPWRIKRPLLIVMVLWQKLVEMFTGICLPYRTKIGPGLYIGHYGGPRINPGAAIGENCTLSPGVSIGISGRGPKRGVPVLGNRVYIAANAVVLGKIRIGDDAMIGPNSTVTKDVPAHTTVLGVPAQVINEYGSAGYIILE